MDGINIEKLPRVLIVAGGRINANDTGNNGLLLRNLFSFWPKEKLAQIYFSEDNGDAGFFGHYYQLGSSDRRMGKVFLRLKRKALAAGVSSLVPPTSSGRTGFFKRVLNYTGKRFLHDTGFYEIIFKPMLSPTMLRWVDTFQPDLIFAQGAGLALTQLPIMLAAHLKLPLAYYPADDWPSQAYRTKASGVPIISGIVTRAVDSVSRRIVKEATICIAFSQYMQEEYRERYRKEFAVLMHGDEAGRFEKVCSSRQAADDECWIVCTGLFYDNRLSLLDDLDTACSMLKSNGYRVKASVFSVNRIPESLVNRYQNLSVEPCPSHGDLPAVLKAADILFLPERFDESAAGISTSISSKAHLFMFSRKPVIVYSDAVTGIARYAKDEEWAVVVDQRNPEILARAFEKIIVDEELRATLSERGYQTALRNHDISQLHQKFAELMTSRVGQPNRA